METILGLRHLQLYALVLIAVTLTISYLTGRMLYYFRLKAASNPSRYLKVLLFGWLCWLLFFIARLILIAAVLLLLLDFLAHL